MTSLLSATLLLWHGCSLRGEPVNFVLADSRCGLGVEDAVQVVEPVTQIGPPDFDDPHVGHCAALVIPDGQGIAVGDVIGGLHPEGIRPGLPGPGTGLHARSLALDQHRGCPCSRSWVSPAKYSRSA